MQGGREGVKQCQSDKAVVNRSPLWSQYGLVLDLSLLTILDSDAELNTVSNAIKLRRKIIDVGKSSGTDRQQPMTRVVHRSVENRMSRAVHTSKLSFVLLQFLIVEEQDRDEDEEYDDDDDPDPGVYYTWKFIKEHWDMDKPKLIISLIYDFENSFMNRRLLKSILADLVKAAATVEGKLVNAA